MPNLTISVETAAEVRPTSTARDVIYAAAKYAGRLDDYLAHHGFGSGYYIHLPRYINQLVAEGKLEQAAIDAARCFTGYRIPDDIWRVAKALK